MPRIDLLYLAVLGVWGCYSAGPSWGYTAEDDSEGEDTGTSWSSVDELQEECPWNSGWPCTCDVPFGLCSDGNVCMPVSMTDGHGVCAAPVEGGGGCPAVDYEGVPAPVWDPNGTVDPNAAVYCGLVCEGAMDCPSGQECLLILDYNVCGPL